MNSEIFLLIEISKTVSLQFSSQKIEQPHFQVEQVVWFFIQNKSHIDYHSSKKFSLLETVYSFGLQNYSFVIEFEAKVREICRISGPCNYKHPEKEFMKIWL